MFPIYRHHLTTRAGISSPLIIDLTCSYNSGSNTGTITALVENTTSSAISGNLHFVVIENNIPYSWGGMTDVDHVMRDMVPSATGTAVTIPASDTIIRSQAFTIDNTWDEDECYIVSFVQGSSREIYQAVEIKIMSTPRMDYYGHSVDELSGNGNGFVEPGESMRLYITGKNQGGGTYTGPAAISSSDPYVTVNSTSPQSVSLEQGDADVVITVDAFVTGSCPTPYTWTFAVVFGGGYQDDVSFLVVDQSGFSDDMESGEGQWTHSGFGGINDNWHLTTHKSHSSSHSWYSGLESSHQYTNLNDASLISPYFVVTPDSALHYWTQYRLETDWDYSYVEIDNNKGWWQILGELNGMQTSWIEKVHALTAYHGQTVRLRFRFLSDQSVIDEGWYVDDVTVPIILGSNEINKKHVIIMNAMPNPFTNTLNIILKSCSSPVDIMIYDASGCLVRRYARVTDPHITWDARDHSGALVANGVYFLHVTSKDQHISDKVLLIR
ncbi:immune inhibitor A [candidate division WOR-3 bacterium]|nr:immune inhibitor A [candidate division WOR-3 bacterium]